MNKWSQEREDRLTALVAQRLTTSQIGREIGLSRRAVTAKIARMGIQGPARKPSVWTDERVETLKRMQASGFSASQIAAAIDCGMTRNSVIGKFHRLGLVGAELRVNNNLLGLNHKKRSKHVRNPNKVRPVPHARPEPAVFVPVLGPVRFVDRPLDRCGFIADDPKAQPIAQLMVCGELVKPGKPYCAWHCNITFQHYEMKVAAAVFVPGRAA